MLTFTRKPKPVSDNLLLSQLKSIKSITNRKDLKDFFTKYLGQEDIHPAALGAMSEMFYNLGEEFGCIASASKVCDLTPVPTVIEYGSTWWNSVGVYLSYPLINIGTQGQANQQILNKVVLSAYTALCLGISLSKGKAYDSLSIRSKLMHKYQRLFKSFIQKNIDSDFDDVELYKMIFCDKYIAAAWYQNEGLTDNFNQTQESLQDLYNWFTDNISSGHWGFNNATSDVDPENLFKDGDSLHMHYNPEFIQAYNDRKFTFNPSEYRELFNPNFKL